MNMRRRMHWSGSFVVLFCGFLLLANGTEEKKDANANIAEAIIDEKAALTHKEPIDKPSPVPDKEVNQTSKEQSNKPKEEVPHEETEKQIKEDPDFKPYDEDDEDREREEEELDELEDQHVSKYDFDPSEGLTVYIKSGAEECFYEEIKSKEDDLNGAFVVNAAESKIDFQIRDADGKVIHEVHGEAEDEYEIRPPTLGIYALCFKNPDSEGKIVTHVTETLESQHPVEKTHVNILAKYASHLDIRLGEIESEQRLQQIRTQRHIEIQEATKKRLSWNGAIECLVYVLICYFQVVYIKRLLENPRQLRSWV